MTSSDREVLLGRAMEEVGTLMAHRRRSLAGRRMHRDVSMLQLNALLLLHESGAQTVSELAHLFDVSAPSASSIVDRMEEHGLVTRTRNSEDRRVVHVEISEHGRDVVAELMGSKHEHLQNVLWVMTDDELRDLIAGIRAIMNGLNRLSLAQGSTSLK